MKLRKIVLVGRCDCRGFIRSRDVVVAVVVGLEEAAMFILKELKKRNDMNGKMRKNQSECTILCKVTARTIIRKAGQIPRGTSSPGRTIFNLDVMGMFALPAYEK